jgi:hypothetical protein
MDIVLLFLEENELWIYLIAGLAAALTLNWLLRTWHDWRNTVFGLEREIVQRKLAARLTVLVLLGFLILSEFMIVSFVIPAYPRMVELSTPTMDVLAVATVTLPALTDGSATPVNPAEGVPTIGAPVDEGCSVGQIEWLNPKAGDTVSATVELKGTVNVPNLGFYKYEFNQPGSDTWTTIAAGNSPLVNGTIGYWNTSQLASGDYLLRLVVVDNQNGFFPVCLVSVRVANP